jgi:signal transduction histidine kinase
MSSPKKIARTLVYLAAAAPIGAAALGVLIAGWVAAGVLAITPLIVPVLVAFRVAVGLLAQADAALARSLLGVDVHPRASSGGPGFWGRSKAVLLDPVFWRQQLHLALRMTIGFALGVGAVSLLAASVGWIFYPAWYQTNDFHIGSWQVDTLASSFAMVPAGLVGLALALVLTRAFGAYSAWQARALLAEATPMRPTASGRRRALATAAGAAAGVVGLVTVIGALTGHGYFWPEWVALPLALLLAGWAWGELVQAQPSLRRHRAVALTAGLLAALSLFQVCIWAITSRGYFWPAWPAGAAVLVVGVVAAAEHAARRRALTRRVDVLETTRAGAVDAQGEELRRIERDLHDGAQARLVALAMNLGMAEQKLATDPEGAQQLVTEARLGLADALRELRDLARGIHPPVLTDRGLGAALASLADRSALPVTVDAELHERLAPNVETAAYFVAAEAVTNAAKHSGATHVDVRVRRAGDVLELEVADDGAGGADPDGGGLTGLRRRVEALDGRLAVTSPPGGPTTVRAELPCGS